MVANFKTKEKIIITGADKSEALLISELIAAVETLSATKELKLTAFYDVSGDVNGVSIELADKA